MLILLMSAHLRVICSHVDKYATLEITECDNVVRNVEETMKLLCHSAALAIFCVRLVFVVLNFCGF